MRRKANPKVVAAALIEREGRILIARRRRGWHDGGKWEFPGGTVEEGESPEECLERELREELSVDAEIGGLLYTSEHRYSPDFTIRLLVYRATVLSGAFALNVHEEIRWVTVGELVDYEFPEPDVPVVRRLVDDYGPK